MRGLNLELWRQRHEQLLLEAERGWLVRDLRAARRRESSRPGGRGGGLEGWIAKILAAPRFPGEKARC